VFEQEYEERPMKSPLYRLVNAVDCRERTALHYAAMTGNLRILTTLLNVRADVNQQDNEGQTCADHARFLGDNDMITVIRHAQGRKGLEKDSNCSMM
jgi:ankyrin repeat protein